MSHELQEPPLTAIFPTIIFSIEIADIKPWTTSEKSWWASHDIVVISNSISSESNASLIAWWWARILSSSLRSKSFVPSFFMHINRSTWNWKVFLSLQIGPPSSKYACCWGAVFTWDIIALQMGRLASKSVPDYSSCFALALGLIKKSRTVLWRKCTL